MFAWANHKYVRDLNNENKYIQLILFISIQDIYSNLLQRSRRFVGRQYINLPRTQ